MSEGQRKEASRRRGRPPERGVVSSLLAGASTLNVTAAVYVTLLALFGGGLAGWTPGYMLLCAGTIVVACVAAWKTAFLPLDRAPLLGKIALIVIAALPLLQIVPLPPALWHALPGQEVRRSVLALVGLADTWQPISLDPEATALSAILAVGFLVLMTLLLRLSDAAFACILDIMLGIVLLGIVLGIFQVASDGQFPQFFATASGAVMLGFYANKNHMGLVIACAMVLAGFVTSRRITSPGRRRMTVIGILVFGLVCIITTNSRAGLILGALAVVTVLGDVTRSIAWRYRLAGLAGAALLVAVILWSPVFQAVLGRFNDVDGDQRWRFFTWSLPLAKTYLPVGSGAAAFAPLFAANEHLDWLEPTAVNAVHNDYLQLVIELGVPGIVAALLLLGSVAACVPAWWRLAPHEAHRAEMAFGGIVLSMFALHSALDYPLRRPAAWVFFALALAAVYRGAAAARKAA